MGIHEKVEIWREIYVIHRMCHRMKTGIEYREIEVRVYI